MLDLRQKIRPKIWRIIGNGEKINVWYDQWNSVGFLSDIIATRSIYNARLFEEKSIKEVIFNDHWRWPDDWKELYPALAHVKVPNLNPLKEDVSKWMEADGKGAWITNLLTLGVPGEATNEGSCSVQCS
ncbi:reverse transcriptase domain, Reverse transcriptase zinc-binding domain protein [Artemisia annua]|uniref:Reverse transcriptase domain, Reverse transcriptase zinc-binding domain protein n=1 Tax=Artemisia annua TaxID=35608 RepID=A0A2U1MP79_ARTAN|nr:reverse transcriptase domain, Reverse transcriptase zinc-binding domain protein [Artemisia annua]